MTEAQWRRMVAEAAGLRCYGLYGGERMSLKARQARRTRYERLADPNGELDPRERARRADALQRADMLRMTAAREKKRGLRTE